MGELKGYEVIQDSSDCRSCILNDTVQFYSKHCPIDLSSDLALSMKIQTKQKQRIDLFREEVAGLKTEIKEAKVPESLSPNPYLLGGIAILGIFILVGMVVIWLKLKSMLDGKIEPIVNSKITDWLANHVIAEAGSYTNGDFTLTIHNKNSEEVRHGSGSKSGNGDPELRRQGNA